MAKGSNDASLKEAFASHLKETQEQVMRLEEIGRLLDIKVTGTKCVGMEGCIQEGSEALEENGEDNILDLGIIGAGSRVEHYEMAGYTSAISLAKALGLTSVVKTLSTTLSEEVATDAKLSKANESAIASTQKSEG